MRYIVHPGASLSVDRLGGQAAGLARLHRSGVRIPAWFVLTPDACECAPSEREGLTAAHPTVAAEPRRELSEALARLCPNDEPVAVRSSATDEDGSQRSFAGQFESVLFVPPAQVPEAVLTVWRSAFSERLSAYRRAHGLPSATRPPAVLVQRIQREPIRRRLQRGPGQRPACHSRRRRLLRPYFNWCMGSWCRFVNFYWF